MSRRQSNKREADREEPEIDLEPIRRVYAAAIKVLKFGTRWLLTEPSPDAIAGEPSPGQDNGPFMYVTFMDAFRGQLFGFRAKYLLSKITNTIIYTDRALLDAVQYLESACVGIFKSEGMTVKAVATRIKALEIACEILGEVLDDIESDENPTLRPEWDRESRQLRFGQVICREFTRIAPIQFQILDNFQKREWTRSVPSPCNGEKQLRDSVDDLDKGLVRESPIRFEVWNRKPAWFRSRPRSAPV
jgi:hypothetical protein